MIQYSKIKTVDEGVRPVSYTHLGSMVKKKKVAVTAGTLSTCNGLFIFMLIFVVLLVGALSFFPALSLGPIAEYFQMIR